MLSWEFSRAFKDPRGEDSHVGMKEEGRMSTMIGRECIDGIAVGGRYFRGLETTSKE